MSAGSILRLEVENFKSYKGKHTIGPFSDFTCVIGPNGAGKSNVMDAISFVLGLRATYLRSTNLKDLIYAGDAANKARKAHVEMFFEKEDVTYKFRRTVEESGTSKYLLDDKEIKAEEYDNELKKFGILTKARNFLVFQGDVEALANKSTLDLTKLIEQVSGSDQYKKEYDKLKEEYDRAQDAFMINIQKKKGATLEKTKLKSQSKDAKEYDELSNKLSDLQVDYLLWKMYHIEKEIEDNKSKKSKIDKEIAQVNSTADKYNKDLEKKKKEHNSLRKEHIKQSRELKNNSTQVEKAQEKLSRLTVNIKFLKQKIQQETISAQKKETLKDKHQEELNRLLQEKNKAQQDLQDFNEKQTSQGNDQLVIRDSMMDEYKRLKNDLGMRSAKEQQELDHIKSQYDIEHDSLRSSRNTLEKIDSERRSLNDAVDKLKSRIETSNTVIKNSTNQLQQLQINLANHKNQKEELERKRRESESKIESIRDQLRDAKIGKNASAKDLRFREALESMKRLFPGVKGCVRDLCTSSNNKYETAICVALGKNLNAIITENERTAIECIQYLTEQRISQSTFIPLDTIKSKKINERLRRVSNSAKLILDVINYDSSLEAAFLHVVGNTLVCDTLQEAIDLSFNKQDAIGKQRVVTLDGTIINKSGFITGGFKQVEHLKLSTFGNQQSTGKSIDPDSLKNQREAVLVELQSITRDLAQLDSMMNSVESEIGNVENRIKYTKQDVEFTNTKITSLQSEITNADSTLVTLNAQVDKHQTSTNQFQLEMNGIQSNIDRLYDQIFGDFNSRIGFDVRQFEIQNKIKQSEINQQRFELELIIDRIDNLIQVVTSRSKSSSSSSSTSMISNQELLVQADQSESTTLDLIKNLTNQSNPIRDQIKNLKQEMDDKELEIQTIKSLIRKQVDDVLREQKKSITLYENNISSLRTKRIDLYKKCQMEEIELPTVDDDDESPKKRSDSNYLIRSESFQGIMIDFSNLDRNLLNLTGRDYQESNKQFQIQIDQLSQDLDRLAPSLKVTNRQGIVNERFDESKKLYDQARLLLTQVTDKLDAIKKKRFDTFMKAFDSIQNAIDGIYKDLTRSKTFKMGGTAHISLDDPDEPYLQGIKYNAMPPTKRYRALVQLSGGEKTIAALALLFAIHQFRPSPFFILDEVDAALDAANVNKIGNYVKNKAGKDAQFLVISLKENFFGRADSLVGVYRDHDTKSSGVLTFDLKDHEYDGPQTPRGGGGVPVTPSTAGSRTGGELLTPGGDDGGDEDVEQE
ncbi:structural maintenance of chromosome SMC1 [Acrasis kona]|uniref:Structural maintenance of chromosomes protein n=1 Tax=Acrasis kona TaxID=1008807 RepID=A0AAW2ZPM3_9EUKA